MKNTLLIWNILLTLAAGLLLYLYFTGKKSNTTVTPLVKTDSVVPPLRIAYFEMDSVETNFNLVKEVKEEINKKNIELSNNVSQLDDDFRKKYNEYAAKENMTPEENASAQNILKQMSETMKGQKEKYEQDYQDFVMRKNSIVRNDIEDYLKIFNKDKQFNYIISYEQGLFYYKDTAFNITSQLIKGLNEHYPSGKK